MRILVVDDEPELVEQVRQALVKQQYTVDTALDGEEAMDRVYVDPYDLILLDIMLPKKDGFDVLRELREEKKKTPVLMLTAMGDVGDRIKGLDLGADDYLAKPFAMEELLARVRALLRRSNELVSPRIEVETVSLNTATREVHQCGEPVELTPKEFSILEFLFYNLNRAISRYTLAEHVWGDEFDPVTMSNSIDVHIKNLRKKLGPHGAQIIHTVRGVGYMVRDERA
ncbi:response regulator transcription factor [Desulfogranum japonicum]|uniref:response regulator transcription factor n=1 Tax=Desulfogranum japonicum TaxID=231447 RepID=UPI000426F32D|nr:response regulator transcription factor [Desulfogranum japonicum]